MSYNVLHFNFADFNLFNVKILDLSGPGTSIRTELKERPHEAALLVSGGLERSGACPKCQRQGYTLDKLPVCPRVMKTHNHPLSHLHILPGFHLICGSSDCGRKLKLETTYRA